MSAVSDQGLSLIIVVGFMSCCCIYPLVAVLVDAPAQIVNDYMSFCWLRTKRQPPAKMPEETMTQRPPGHDGRATGADEHQNTTTRAPRPAARAADAQEPEPMPQKHERADADGHRPDGQADETKTARMPCGRGRADTMADDRRAYAGRPEPHRPDATEKTCAPGTA